MGNSSLKLRITARLCFESISPTYLFGPRKMKDTLTEYHHFGFSGGYDPLYCGYSHLSFS